MQAKEFMQSVHKAEVELIVISAKRRHYQDLMMAIGSKISGMPGKPSGASKTEAAAIGLVELTTALAVKEAEYVALVRKAEALIEKIPQENFRRILTFRYLCRMSWKSIRDEMGYKDEKSTYRCHGYALRELQKVM